MKRNLSILVFLFFLLLNNNNILAQRLDSAYFFQPKVDDVLKLKKEEEQEEQTKVAGQLTFAVREAPAAVTVITDEQLKQWGITDLIDVFRFVPGFEINRDLNNTRNISVRGNWGGEAKVLVIIDGMQMNELSYGSYVLGGRFSVAQIKKIEIIRGPGSAIYGGLAGLAVINITTKNATEKKFVEGSFTSEISQRKFLRQQTDFSLGRRVSNVLSYQVHANLQESNISNRFLDLPRGKSSFADSSRVSNHHLLAGLQYKNLRMSGMYESMKIKRTLDIYNSGDYSDFSGGYFFADYNWKINSRFTLIPEFSYKLQEPWNSYRSTQTFYNMLIGRTQGSVRMLYQLKDNLAFMLGTEYYHLRSRFKSDTVFFFNNKNYLDIDNVGFFAEMSYQSRLFNLVLGARYDNHQFAGDAFVPRFSLTKAFHKFHYKILYAEAFKTPVVSNLQLSVDANIKPENIRYAEVELGYKINEKISLNTNFFYNNIYNSIIFDASVSQTGGYANKGNSNVWGIEGQVNYNSKYFQAFLQYANYQPTGNSSVFLVEGINYAKQGIATHKISLHTHTKLSNKLSFTFNAYYFSQRFYYGPEEFDQDNGLRILPAVTLFDAVIWWKKPFQKPIDLQFYLRDMGNEQFSYAPAYQLNLYPLPAPARTWGVRLFFSL